MTLGTRVLLVFFAVSLPTPARAEPSPGRATVISVSSTLVPCALGAAAGAPGWGLAAAGVIVGPATGYVYGGMPARGLKGLGLRDGAAGLAARTAF